jgi:vancomycin resistance protein VanW
MLLHTEMAVIERKGHDVKEFPEPNSDEVKGVDATVFEGWIDLKAHNGTSRTYQLAIGFDDENITGTVFVDAEPQTYPEVINTSIKYIRENGKINEYADIERVDTHACTGEEIARKLLYTNICEIRYPLPERIVIKEAKDS